MQNLYLMSFLRKLMETKNNILSKDLIFFEKIEKNYKIFLTIILSVGFFLRFYAVFIGLGSNHYSKIDELEAYIWGQQLRYYGHPRFFTYIPGPYLSLIAYLLVNIFNTVNALYYFWVILGTLSIYLVFWLSKKIFSFNSSQDDKIKEKNRLNIEYPNILSLLIALIFAVFPWSIKYTVSYWNPHFMIILSTLMLGYLFDILTKDKSKNIFGLALTIAIMPFFHMIIIYAIPVILLMVIFKKRITKLNYLYLFFGLVFSIIIWLPFFIFDKNTNFFILNSYIHNNSVIKFKPETLKIIINPLLIVTLDISRFIGHYFFEYTNFLDRAYGFFIIGLIPVLTSGFLAIYSFYISFKSFSIKNFIKEKINPINYILIYMLGVLFFHLLSLQVHEDRYTVIFFSVPYIILGYSWYQLLFSFNIKKTIFKRFLLICILICIILAPYITLSHFCQERYPNFGDKIRLIPSLIYYEKIKYFIIKDYFSIQGITEKPENFIHFINYDKTTQLLKNHSLFNYKFLQDLFRLEIKDYEKRKLINDQLNNSEIKYCFTYDNLYIEKDGKRQKQIIQCIERFINTNTSLIEDISNLENISNNKNIKIYFLKFYSNNSKIPEKSIILGKYSNFILVKSEEQ